MANFRVLTECRKFGLVSLNDPTVTVVTKLKFMRQLTFIHYPLHKLSPTFSLEGSSIGQGVVSMNIMDIGKWYDFSNMKKSRQKRCWLIIVILFIMFLFKTATSLQFSISLVLLRRSLKHTNWVQMWQDRRQNMTQQIYQIESCSSFLRTSITICKQSWSLTVIATMLYTSR